MKKHSLKVDSRKILGRKVKSLRQKGVLPANLYGAGIKSQAVAVNKGEFAKVFAEVGETGIVELTLGKVKKPVLISNPQVDPVTAEPLHVDFRQVDLTRKIAAMVPVEVIGESPAEKSGLGTVVQQLTEIEVEALPGDLPEKFVVDASGLTEVDQAITAGDLEYAKNKVELSVDPGQIVIKVEPPQKEEEVAPPPPAEGEGEGEAPTPAGEVKEEAPAASAEKKEEPAPQK